LEKALGLCRKFVLTPNCMPYTRSVTGRGKGVPGGALRTL
jgi:hypothetical protein